MRRLIRLALACGVGVSIGCYSERLPPPTYRYACDADEDCDPGEVCLDGLCQIPCTQATFDEDCPSEDFYIACFNGVCSDACTVGKAQCPAPQSCISLGLDVSGGDGGFTAGAPVDDPIGVCGVECEPGSCPEGEQCLQGFCVAQCESDADCSQGLACVAGLCLPSEIPDTTTGGTGTSDGSETTTGQTGTSSAGGTGTSTGGTQ